MGQVRKNVSLSPEYERRIVARMKAAGEGRSKVITRFIEEAGANFIELRHALRQPLNAILAHCAILRRSRHGPDDLAEVQAIESLVDQANLLLAQKSSV